MRNLLIAKVIDAGLSATVRILNNALLFALLCKNSAGLSGLHRHTGSHRASPSLHRYTGSFTGSQVHPIMCMNVRRVPCIQTDAAPVCVLGQLAGSAVKMQQQEMRSSAEVWLHKFSNNPVREE